MSGNGSVLKKSRCGKEKGITPCGRLLLGYIALLIVNLISPPALATSVTGLSDPSLGSFAIEASAFSTDWSKVTGSELTSQTFV